jgi:hypothetical protein
MAVTWPAHLAAGAVRFARSSLNYEETVAFYRDDVGLPVVGEFAESYGEDGTIFGLPDTPVQLEVVRGHDPAVRATASDQLVFYLPDTDSVARATASLRGRGIRPTQSAVAYWDAHGAQCFRDPDGREVIYAPWVYGSDADPSGP